MTGLDDFHPPYHLGAFGCALVGVWKGGGLGAAFVLRYDRPPEDHCVVYNEIILANVARRGAELVAVPFDLILDDQFYVDAGRHHYHLPKRLDATLRIDVERSAAGIAKRVTASGSDIAFSAALGSVKVPCAKGIASALLRGFTNHVPVIGTASQPHLRALIGISPDPTTAYRARSARLTAGGRTLRSLGAVFWEKLEVTVGVPRPVSDTGS